MKCFGRGVRRIAPAPNSSKKEVVPPVIPKVNGWACPPPCLQRTGWLVFTYMAIVGFGIYIPLLPSPWSQAAYSLTGIAFIVHLVSHIATVSIDPVNAGVRAKMNYSKPLPAFDRKKQPHVIYNMECSLCEVPVGPKVKHCSFCNKCIEKFDHHCDLLNTCVGGRNYWPFFTSVLSAFIGTVLLFVIVLFVFIQHYVDPSNLRTAPQFDYVSDGTWLVFLPLAPIETSSAGLLVVAFLTLMPLSLCLLLSSELLSFHFYLCYRHISTYEYIYEQRYEDKIKKEKAAKLAKASAVKQDTLKDKEAEKVNEAAGAKSLEGGLVVQDPLGSSIMGPSEDSQ
ncbi:palmitoyltransferase ZDHHC11-like [Aplochiton taeniatus]